MVYKQYVISIEKVQGIVPKYSFVVHRDETFLAESESEYHTMTDAEYAAKRWCDCYKDPEW